MAGRPEYYNDSDQDLVDSLEAISINFPHMTDWEQDFTQSLMEQVGEGKELSPAQRAKAQEVIDLYARYQYHSWDED